MSQEEVGQIVYLPVQLMTVGGRRPIPRYVDTRAQDEHIDWSAQSEDAGRELADRRQRRKIDGVMLPRVRNRAARAHQERGAASHKLRRKRATDPTAPAREHNKSSVQHTVVGGLTRSWIMPA